MREVDLKSLNRYLENVDECIVGLEANIRVCKALTQFYKNELLQDPKLGRLGQRWIIENQIELEESIDEATAKITNTCNASNAMLRRAMMVKQIGTRREGMVRAT